MPHQHFGSVLGKFCQCKNSLRSREMAEAWLGLGVKIGRIFVGFRAWGKVSCSIYRAVRGWSFGVALWHPTLRKEREGWSGYRGKNRCFYPR